MGNAGDEGDLEGETHLCLSRALCPRPVGGFGEAGQAGVQEVRVPVIHLESILFTKCLGLR